MSSVHSPGSTVSVVVATFHRSAELVRALDSLAAQTMRPHEVIIVDDNADHEWNVLVGRIVDEFRSAFSGTVVLVQNDTSLGSAETRNVGVRMATGEYVTFLDDDDVYLPSKIEHQVNHMVSEASDFSITDLQLLSETGRLVENRRRFYLDTWDQGQLLRNHLMHHMTGTDTMMFRRDYLNCVGGFPPIDVGDEFYLMLNAIVNGGRFSYLSECDVTAYVHTSTGGLSSGTTKIEGENRLYAKKQAYFLELDHGAVAYIKMRHWAVLSYAELRRKRYILSLHYAAKSFISSPLQCVHLLRRAR